MGAIGVVTGSTIRASVVNASELWETDSIATPSEGVTVTHSMKAMEKWEFRIGDYTVTASTCGFC